MGNVNEALRQRYRTGLDDAVEDMPIAEKVELFRGLQQQASLLSQLEDELVRSLKAMVTEEDALREREEFLERRRLAYMKRIDPASAACPDSDDDEDDAAEDAENVHVDSVAGGEATVAGPAPSKAANDERTLGSIEVLDWPSEQKHQELKTFLDEELPEIQRTVALRARTMWFKRKEYEEKLAETQAELQKVCHLVESLEPGLPPLVLDGSSPAV